MPLKLNFTENSTKRGPGAILGKSTQLNNDVYFTIVSAPVKQTTASKTNQAPDPRPYSDQENKALCCQRVNVC